jgi:predicted transcriptional regulator
MNKTGPTPLDSAVPLTDDVADMADHMRSAQGRAAIRQGLKDIEEGRVLVGKGVLAAELMRRATSRREKR